jgi:hypothetical protein
MPIDLSNIASTIVPKSDQLNADQLLGGPLTITITSVTAGSDDQPIAIHYAGEEGRPYKPGKTMRKVLAHGWGPDARKWTGRSLTLFNDAAVIFGGQAVGGIRISHMSDIDKPIQISLNSTRGKKAQHKILKMERVGDPAADSLTAAADEEMAALGAAFGKLNPADKIRLTALKNELKAKIESAQQSEVAP